MCSVLTSMATKENLVATEENTSDSTSERVDESEEVSVGSPEEPQGEDDGDCSPPPPPSEPNRVVNGSNTTTTSALRVFRGRKRRSSADSTEEDGPLDFSSAKDGGLGDDNMPPKSYFLPFKKLEMTNSEAASAMAMASAAQKLLKPVAVAASTMHEQAAISAKNKRKSGVAGFSIDDILSHKTAALKGQKDSSGHHEQQQQQQQPIVRPWDIHVGSGGGTSGPPTPSATAAATAMAAALHRKQSKQTADDSGDSPLDALFQMASKTFEGLKAKTELDPSQLTFTSKQPPKKKRKSRTAFTNHQIFELEKRFLYQKYLSPADRDEIAAQLGLSNAQVITWFQNRRAKLKRDMEELRKDVECTSQVMPHALASGHPHQVAAAAAVAASVLASRNAAAAAVAVSKYNSAALDLHHHHRSISAPHLNSAGSLPAGITSGFSGISETGSSTSLISPRSPPDSALIGQACENSRSPPIRVTDSDG